MAPCSNPGVTFATFPDTRLTASMMMRKKGWTSGSHDKRGVERVRQQERSSARQNGGAGWSLLIWHCGFLSSATNHTRRARLAARILRDFVQNQPEVSNTSLIRQEIKNNS